MISDLEVLQDLRLAFKRVRRSGSSSLLALILLALSLGFATATFSIVDGLLLRGLPFAGADRLMALSYTGQRRGGAVAPVELEDFLRWRQQQESFDDLAAFQASFTFLSHDASGTGGYVGAYVTTGLFELLGVRPTVGQGLQPEDFQPGGDLVAVLSYDLWTELFNRDSNVVGRQIRVNREFRTVVGVMPEGFGFPYRQKIWMPLPLENESSANLKARVFAVGRLRQGVTRTQAEAELNLIGQRVAAGTTGEQRLRVSVERYVEANTDRRLRSSLYTLLGTVGLFLLISCANVSTIRLVDAAHRGQEMAIRAALGAGQGRILSQLLAEAFLLVALGGVLGLGVAELTIEAFRRWMASGRYLEAFWINVGLNGASLLLSFCLLAVVTVLVGLAPAVLLSRPQLLGGGGYSQRGIVTRRVLRLQRILVTFEVAISSSLLVAAGLMILSIMHLREFELGYETAGITTARLSLHAGMYEDEERQLLFYRELSERLSTAAETQEVALSSVLPTLRIPTREFVVGGFGSGSTPQEARWVVISPGFFDVLGVAPVSGRAFRWSDDDSRRDVVIVSQEFAARHFGEEKPVGRTLLLDGDRGEQATIIGVAPNLALGGIGDAEDASTLAVIYSPLGRYPRNRAFLFARSRSPSSHLGPTLRREIAALDPAVAFYGEATLKEVLARSSWRYDVFGRVFALFGGVALIFAIAGLYGAVSFSVSSRSREFGIRVAMGAGSADIRRLVVTEGLRQLAVGLVAGFILAATASRWLENVLFDVKPLQISVFAGIALGLLASGLAACLIPSRRAERSDPMLILR